MGPKGHETEVTNALQVSKESRKKFEELYKATAGGAAEGVSDCGQEFASPAEMVKTESMAMWRT
jgi:hypothetical protein